MTRTTARTHLQYPLWQPRLLCQLLEVFGVRILVDGEVRLHGPQLMVLERSPHPFRPLLLAVPGRPYRGVVGQWFHGWGEISWVQHFCRTRRVETLWIRRPYGCNTCVCCLLLSLATGHFQGEYSGIYVNLTARYPIVRVIKSRRMRWARHVARMGGEERRIQGFGGETWRKETTWGPRRRWEDNIKMDLQEMGCGVVDWFELAQDRDRWRVRVNAVMNLRVP